MAQFLFDCTDEVALPAAYKLVEDLKPYIDKIKDIDVPEGATRRETFKHIIENMMVKYPKETGEIFSRLWVLEKGEKSPNAFKTMAELLRNEVAVDFFTSVLPSLIQLSGIVSSK